MIKRGDREQLKATVVLFNKSSDCGFFFCCCCQQLGHGYGRAVEEIEREKCKEKERETCIGESQTYKFFGIKNKYGMY